MFHPAPTVPLVLLLLTFPYNWLRAPGDVVENEVIVAFSNVAANITTAALAEAVVIEGSEIAVPGPPVVKLPGGTSKGPEVVSTPENATIAPEPLVAFPNEKV
jgi:hypothetical protein